MILLVRVLDTVQAERAARVLPRLAFAVPMEAKLRQNLPQLRRGRLAELNPNPFADNLCKIKQAGIAGFQKFQNFWSGQGAVFLPRFRVNRQPIVFLFHWRNCALCFRCVCAAELCGSALEPDLIFLICFHGLFFSALLCVFCPSPFTKKRSRQPSPVGVGFRGNRARRAGVLGKAVRATERNASRKSRT